MRFLCVFRPLVINVCRRSLIRGHTVILYATVREYRSRYLFRRRVLVLSLMFRLYRTGCHTAGCSISSHYGVLLSACSYIPMMTADMQNDPYTGFGLQIGRPSCGERVMPYG